MSQTAEDQPAMARGISSARVDSTRKVRAAAAGFGPIQRLIGDLTQLVRRRRMLRKQADPDTGADAQRVSVDRDRSVQRRQQALGKHDGAGAARSRRLHDGELVPADPGQGIALPNARARKALRHGHQNAVARQVAEAVIHRFEAVQVKEVQRHRLALSLATAQGLIQSIIEQPAVRQVGQRIVMGQVPDAVARGGGVGKQATHMLGLGHQESDQDAAAHQNSEEVTELLQVQPSLQRVLGIGIRADRLLDLAR